MRYDDDPGTTESEDDFLDPRNGSGGKWAAAILLVILAASMPTVIIVLCLVAAGVWSLLRYERLRPSIVSVIGGVIALVSMILLITVFKPASMFASAGAALRDGNGFGKVLGVWAATSPLMLAGACIGAILGVIFAFGTRWRMQRDPYLVQREGEKYYHFRYRRTPLQMMRRRSLVRSLKDDTFRPSRKHGEGFGFGIEEEPINPPDNPADIPVDRPICRMDDEVPTHTVITGQTGSGKTITMQNLIRHDMEKQKTMFILDCKNDPKFAAKIASWCQELHLDFRHFAPAMASNYRIHDNPAGPAFYDPLAHGGVDTKTDMMISTREWDASAEIYKSSAQSLLQTVFSIMENMNPSSPYMADVDTSRGSMYTFYELVRNTKNLISASETVPASSQARALADELIGSLKTKRSREGENAERAMNEYKSMLRGLMSSAGKYMRLSTDSGRKNIDVFDLASAPGNVVLFSLNATKSTDIGVIIASMICTDLTNMTSSRANSGQTNPVSIYIDEFQSIPPSAVKSMMEKARSAGIGITLAFQSVQQVTAASGSDAFINALIDTCNNFVFHAGANESTAKIMSEIVGQHTVNDYTLQRRNQQGIFDINYRNRRNTNTQERAVDKYIVEPRVFQKLASPSRANGFKSEAVIIKKSSSDPIDARSTGAVAHKVWMIPPDDVVDDTGYFDPTSPVMEFDDEEITSGFPDSAGEDSDSGTTTGMPPMSASADPNPMESAYPQNTTTPSIDIDDLFADASASDSEEPLSNVRIGENRQQPQQQRQQPRPAEQAEPRRQAPAGGAQTRNPAETAGRTQTERKPKGRNRPVSPLRQPKEDGIPATVSGNNNHAAPGPHNSTAGKQTVKPRTPVKPKPSGQHHRGGLPII